MKTRTSKEISTEIFEDVCDRIKKDGYVATGFIDTYDFLLEEYVLERIQAFLRSGVDEILENGFKEYNKRRKE